MSVVTSGAMRHFPATRARDVMQGPQPRGLLLVARLRRQRALPSAHALASVWSAIAMPRDEERQRGEGHADHLPAGAYRQQQGDSTVSAVQYSTEQYSTIQ